MAASVGLGSQWEQGGSKPEEMYRARTIVVFATIGQGRADGKITPEEENTVLGKLLTHWALTSTLEAAAGCATPRPPDDTFRWGIKHDEPIPTTTRRTPWPNQQKSAQPAFAGMCRSPTARAWS